MSTRAMQSFCRNVISVGVVTFSLAFISSLCSNNVSTAMEGPIKSCKIILRNDQRSRDIDEHSDPQVSIYAPRWVKKGLSLLGEELEGVIFQVFENKNHKGKVLKQFTLNKNIGLADLQKIARNEGENVSGIIKRSYYADGGVNDFALLLAINDLVRQSIIVGRVFASNYGGYGASRKVISPPVPVYICDLAALQFQHYYNTGRLVLLQQTHFGSDNVGLLDNLIFENVVGEARKSYEDAVNDTARYILVEGFSHRDRSPTLFDTFAYKQFVSSDVVITGLAICDTASKNREKVNFKFLKYGTGFFAGSLRKETNELIFEGVVLGLEKLFQEYTDQVKDVIKHVEFPFYDNVDIEARKRLDKLKNKYGFTYSISKKDALKPMDKFITATTNCGDTMAVFGNEMGFTSVDAAIAENLVDKGNTLCPILNPTIKEKFLDIS